MPKRITNMSITLVRDGKRVKLPAGVAFDFTKEELDELKTIVKDAVRTPVNESESVAEVKAPEPVKADTKSTTTGNKHAGSGSKSSADDEL